MIFTIFLIKAYIYKENIKELINIKDIGVKNIEYEFVKRSDRLVQKFW